MRYACIACIAINFILKMEKKKELATSLFRRMQIQNKENKDA